MSQDDHLPEIHLGLWHKSFWQWNMLKASEKQQILYILGFIEFVHLCIESLRTAKKQVKWKTPINS